METSLHRQLKEMYAGKGALVEQRLGPFRIDAVRGKQLIEIQHGSLAAIQGKIARLLETHRVLVVKPIVVRKTLVKLAARGGAVVSRRLSPKVGKELDLFHELVYFTRVFPHPNLTLEMPLVDIEEWRYPGHGRRRRWKWRASDFEVEDQRLAEIHATQRFRTAADLLRLIPTAGLPQQFHTGDLATALGVQRWVGQRVAYCLHKTGAALDRGKAGNSRLYELIVARKKGAKSGCR